MPVKYDLSVLIAAVALLLTVSGCAPGKSDVIDEFAADAGSYSLVVFANEQVDRVVRETNAQLISLYPNMFGGKGVFDVNEKANKQKADALHIRNYPTYVVLDHKQIVMQTTDMDDIVKLAHTILSEYAK